MSQQNEVFSSSSRPHHVRWTHSFSLRVVTMVRNALLSVGLAAVAAAAPLVPRQTVTCVSGLYILAARGSTQAVGEGSVGVVADAIEALVPNSVSSAIVYPAALIDDDGIYFPSVNDGITNTKAQLKAYVDQCGSASRIALIGYSQGAHVMTDTLAGGTLTQGPIEDEYAQYVEAVVAFADPRHVAGQSYDVGTATKDGLFARGDTLAKLNTFSSILRSYCDANDPFCARGLDLDVHYANVDTYMDDAVNFVVGLTT